MIYRAIYYQHDIAKVLPRKIKYEIQLGVFPDRISSFSGTERGHWILSQWLLENFFLENIKQAYIDYVMIHIAVVEIFIQLENSYK